MELCFIFKKQVHLEFKTIEQKSNQAHHSTDWRALHVRLKLHLG